MAVPPGCRCRRAEPADRCRGGGRARRRRVGRGPGSVGAAIKSGLPGRTRGSVCGRGRVARVVYGVSARGGRRSRGRRKWRGGGEDDEFASKGGSLSSDVYTFDGILQMAYKFYQVGEASSSRNQSFGKHVASGSNLAQDGENRESLDFCLSSTHTHHISSACGMAFYPCSSTLVDDDVSSGMSPRHGASGVQPAVRLQCAATKGSTCRWLKPNAGNEGVKEGNKHEIWQPCLASTVRNLE
eukprot:132884-Hanusia_phi.AAC.1